MTAARVAIVGGGVSGLATAYFLKRAGISSILFEKTARLGGLIQTDRIEGCLLEAGPDSYLAAKPSVAELAAELPALTHAGTESNDARRRVFIVRSGVLTPFPAGMSMMVPGRWIPALRSGLFGWRTKARFLAETFSRPRERPGDISVGALVSEHFGSEVLEYAAEPLLTGVYGGEAATLSAASVLPRFLDYERRYGSLIRGVRGEAERTSKTNLFRSFREGMQSLTDALAGEIPDRVRVVHEEVTSITRVAAGWEVRTAQQRLSATHLVLACPTHVSARLLEPETPELAGELAAIPYASSILVTLLYQKAMFAHPLDGFGFLVPRREQSTIAAATWINTKFPGRVAPGLVAIRAFIVADQAEKLLSSTDDVVGRLVSRDLGVLMQVAGAPRTVIVRRWPKSMPQYIVGHAGRQERIARKLSEMPSLHLVGNAFDGIGVPDCVRRARETASRLARIKSF